MRHSRFILVFAFAVLAPAGGLAADCTMAQLAISPYSVIDPCTRRLEQPGLTDQREVAGLFRPRPRLSPHLAARLTRIATIGAAFDLDPKNAEILVSWSNVDLRQDGDGRAYAARVEQAYELSPDDPHVLRTVGGMFR